MLTVLSVNCVVILLILRYGSSFQAKYRSEDTLDLVSFCFQRSNSLRTMCQLSFH